MSVCAIWIHCNAAGPRACRRIKDDLAQLLMQEVGQMDLEMIGWLVVALDLQGNKIITVTSELCAFRATKIWLQWLELLFTDKQVWVSVSCIWMHLGYLRYLGYVCKTFGSMQAASNPKRRGGPLRKVLIIEYCWPKMTIPTVPQCASMLTGIYGSPKLEAWVKDLHSFRVEIWAVHLAGWHGCSWCEVRLSSCCPDSKKFKQTGTWKQLFWCRLELRSKSLRNFWLACFWKPISCCSECIHDVLLSTWLCSSTAMQSGVWMNMPCTENIWNHQLYESSVLNLKYWGCEPGSRCFQYKHLWSRQLRVPDPVNS